MQIAYWNFSFFIRWSIMSVLQNCSLNHDVWIKMQELWKSLWDSLEGDTSSLLEQTR